MTGGGRVVRTLLAGLLAAAPALAATSAAAAVPEPAPPRLDTELAHPGPGTPDRAAAGPSAAIPAFSRKYRTSCSTCHVAPGKLNSEGEAFRLNGYRFPDGDEGLRKDDPVPLGAEPWKELWPGSIWPGEIPDRLPLALHLANDLHVTRRADGGLASSYLFPAAVNLQAATTLGGGVAAYVDIGWRPGSGVQVGEAKVKVQDPLPWLPPRALNLWVGAQAAHLLTFADPALDRAARQLFQWQRFRLADWELEDPDGGATLVSGSTFRLGGVRPAIELNGLALGRFYYGIGLAQAGSAATGAESATDVYIKLRQKLAGGRLDGRAPPGFEPRAWGGQLLEHGLTLEQFAYFGEVALGDGSTDVHRSYGLAARAVLGRADLGVGHVRGRNSGPWGETGPAARHESTFTRGEYLIFPWLIASLKADRTRYRASAPGLDAPRYSPLRRSRVLPGAVILVRHNVRVIAEGEAFLRDEPGSAPGERTPHALWLRLHVAY